MRRCVVVVVAALATASGCGVTARSTSATVQNPLSPNLTSATATCISREHGKDKDSGLTVQLLRSNAELVAKVRANGFKFDDNSSSGPFAFALTGPYRRADIDDSQIRIRLTPDGRDEWTFDLNLMMRFDDASTRTFVWRGIRLDNTEPERTLALAPARIPQRLHVFGRGRSRLPALWRGRPGAASRLSSTRRRCFEV